jgi:uroporphyrinogen decarboxylase
MASGRCLDIVDDLAATGTAGIGVSALEEIGMVKQAVRGRMTIIGNLNGIEMVRWTKAMTEKKVKETIQRAGKGGGFVLSDNHGEIPYQVSFETLEWIADAARRHGKYPFS